jgi:hypothetical protein
MALPGAALPQLLPLRGASSRRSTVPAKISEPAEIRTAQRTQIPATYLSLEPKPLSAYNDDGVLNEQGAASVLGVSAEQMKKWRQRKQGPNYIQYGKDGPVRYELKALMAFRDYCRVYLTKP